MSTKFPGGFITKSPVAPTSTAASGIWTLDQQQQAQKAGTWPAPPVFIEDMFSTWLYTGNGSTQTITNGIDLANKGGLVWTKFRNGTFSTGSNILWDTARGVNPYLVTDTTAAQTGSATLGSFNSNGFTLNAFSNNSNNNFVSWTFQEQPKFFDIVTYTGNGANRTIAHNLGSVPGCIIVKRTNTTSNWQVYHRSLAATQYVVLNTTASAATGATRWNSTTPTDTVFSLGTDATVNASGSTYVAYLFAHDAGGFGLTGTDNVISCGSFTTDGSGNATVNLGYEPQWVMMKASSTTTAWSIFDNMRGMPVSGGGNELEANTSGAESPSALYAPVPTATGFSTAYGIPSATVIYIAIRRGPMKVPTTGTSVFAVNFGSDVTTYTTNFPLDMGWDGYTLGGATDFMAVGARLLDRASLATASTAAESTAIIPSGFWQSNTSYRFNAYGNDCATYAFRRAPGFFDVVCYTGTGSARTLSHNLGAVPEMIIVKTRDLASNWEVYSKDLNALGTETADDSRILLNSTAAATANNVIWNSTPPTATVFSVGASSDSNRNGNTFVAYLFASCPGVSKVGSFTGTGATQVINCGFTGGARFVLIKSTSTSGDWYLWDSARGIVAGNDPYLRLNTNAAEVTTRDWVDTAASGFELSNAGGNLANSNGVSYIFLAIA
jgi:hypothetical protein